MRWNDEAQASVRGFSLAKRSSKGKSDNLVKRSLRPLLEKAGLPPLTFHKLRHTFATFQLAAGERPKVVQEILGHSSTKTTMDTYSHVIPGMQEEAAGRLQRLLFGPTPVTFPSDDENASRNDEEWQGKIPICRHFLGALGRTRTCDLLIRSQTRSRTGGDREGHGETKPRFYQN